MLKTEMIYVKGKNGKSEGIAPNPYLWLTQDSASIYFQDGEFYTGKGEEPIDYEKVPEWFWNTIRSSYLITERGRNTIASLNLILPEKRVKTEEDKIIEKEVKAEEVKAKMESLWTCNEPDCGEEMRFVQKGLHLARHKLNKTRMLRNEEKLELIQSEG